MRKNCEALDNIFEKQIPVLDCGFIRVVDYMGGDHSIVQSARVSYGQGTKQVNQDKALINYLMRHEHSSPFEQAFISFHVKCPIFIARQWMRHRSFSYNEISGRYSILSDEFYTPDPKQIRVQDNINRQASAEPVNEELAEDFINQVKVLNANSYRAYQDAIKDGISRETARILLSLNCYTEFYCTTNVRNWLHFIRLRFDQNAQYEIMVYAEEIYNVFKLWVPYTMEAFDAKRFEISITPELQKELLNNLTDEKINSFSKHTKQTIEKMKKNLT